MMSDNKIIALIQGLSEQVSAQYEGVGIKSILFIEPNIFRYTLNDTSNTIVDVPIENFNNYSLADKAKVKKLITNGLGDLYLSNDGTYKKPTLNNVLNYNKPIIINSSDWRQNGALEDYSVIIKHDLNNENIIPALYNNSNKLETVGFEILNNNQVKLESTSPLSGKLVLNYSTTDASDSLNNIATIKTEYNFDTMTDVNTYFSNTPNALENRLIIGVGTNPVKILMWTGITSPTSYNSTTDAILWSDQTALVGIKGDVGTQGERGYSDYELAKQNGFVGTMEEWLESIDSCLGKFDTAEALISKYPPVTTGYPSGVNSHKFALVADIDGTGLVSMAFYDATTTHKWNLIKLNQAIPASQSTSVIGVTGNTATRLSLLNNPDWLGKEYLFFDDELHILLLYKQGCGFLQYSGQEVLTIAPQNPNDGDVWIGFERVYVYNSDKKFWKIKLKDYLKKYELTTQGSYLSEAINGASIRFIRDNNDIYSISIHQDNGMDYLIYTVNTYEEQEIMLNKDDEKIIVSNLQTDANILITIHLKHEGGGISANVVRYGNVLFLTSFTKLIDEDPTYQSMSTIERKKYKQDLRNDSHKKVVYDTDLDVEMLYRPKDNDIGTFIQNVGQFEVSVFPTDSLSLVDGFSFTGTFGNKYLYDATNDYWRCVYNAKTPNFATSGTTSDLGVASSLGSSEYVARLDHVHKFPTSTEIGLGNVTNDAQVKRSEIGIANGVASLGSDGKVPASQLNIASGLTYKGTWNASTNTPTIPSANNTNQNQFYIVNIAGSTTIGTNSSWSVGDWIMSDGSQWSKVPSTQSIISVNGKTGTVIISKDDVNLGNVQNVDQTNGSNITTGIISPSVLPTATTTTLGIMEAGDGLNVLSGVVTPNLGVGLKLDIEKKIVPDTNNIDVTKLKNADTLVLGMYVTTFNNNDVLSKFTNAKRGNFWIYNGANGGAIGGYTFNIGDQLWCNTTITGTPSDLTTNFSLIPSTVAQATTNTYGTVKLGNMTPLVDSGIASSGISNACAREDHVHPSDINKVDKVSTTVTGDIVTFGNTTGSLSDSGKKISIDGTLTNNSDNNIPTEKAIKTYINSIIGTIYPVGHIIMTDNSANPATYLGFGTWSPYGAGKVPVGIDSTQAEFNTLGKTGGEKTHTLSMNEMPQHNHANGRYSKLSTVCQNGDGNVTGAGSADFTLNEPNLYSNADILYNGGNAPHNNLQPYIVCYMWKRTA